MPNADTNKSNATSVWESLETTLRTAYNEDKNRLTPKDVDALQKKLNKFFEEVRSEKSVSSFTAEESRKRVRTDVSSGDESGNQEEEEEDTDMDTYVDDETHNKIVELDQFLSRIRAFLRRKVPFGSIAEPTLPPGQSTKKDKTVTPKEETSPESRLTASPIYSVDAFLYLENDIDELVEEGKIAREYCQCCGSTDIGLTEFITHSFNQDQLVYLTSFLLPVLSRMGAEAPENKRFSCRTILDVGSRFGVVLWAAYFAAKCGLLPPGVEEVVGVEVDEKFFAIQQEIGSRFCSRQVPIPSVMPQKKSGSKSGKREEKYLSCRVVGSSCFEGEGAEEMKKADVVILHNVFEYFSEGPQGHLECWNQLRSIVNRPGQLLICFPSLEETLEGLERDGAFANQKAKSKEKREQGNEESAALSWISSYVEPVNVPEVPEVFFQYRQASLNPEENESVNEEEDDGKVCAHSHSHHSEPINGKEDHVHEHGEDCGSCCGDEEEIPELLELVKNIHVYRVI